MTGHVLKKDMWDNTVFVVSAELLLYCVSTVHIAYISHTLYCAYTSTTTCPCGFCGVDAIYLAFSLPLNNYKNPMTNYTKILTTEQWLR